MVRENSVKATRAHFRQDSDMGSLQFEKIMESTSSSIHNKEQEKMKMADFMKAQKEALEEQVSNLSPFG